MAAQAIDVQHILGIHVPVFALPNPPISKVWPHIQHVIPVEPGELQLLPGREMPDIVDDQGAIGRLLPLPRVVGIVRRGSVDGNQSRLESEPVVSDSVHRQIVFAEREYLGGVHFVLLSMLQPFQEAVPIGQFKAHPGFVRGVSGAPASHQIDVPIVHGESQHRLQAIAETERDGGVHGIVALAHIESRPVGLHVFDGDGDDYIRIRIAVAVRVGWKIVRIQVSADLKEHGDRLAVIARHAGGEVLGRLYATGRRFHGEPRNRDRHTRPAGVRLQGLFPDKNALGWVG